MALALSLFCKIWITFKYISNEFSAQFHKFQHPVMGGSDPRIRTHATFTTNWI